MTVDGSVEYNGPSDTWSGVVEAVHESLSTDAGTFDTVRSRTTLTSGEDAGAWTRQWISIDLGTVGA